MLGNKLILLREKKDLTKRFMASHFKVNETTYGKWENNTRTPDIYTVKELANYFDVSVDYLLDNDAKLHNECMEINKAMSLVDGNTRLMMLQTLKSAFPYAFDEYEWALSVLKTHNVQGYNMLKEGKSELSKQDVIKMAKSIEGGK